MVNEKICKYLKDEPIKVENSHIVRALADELQNNDGKIIGLLGSWGSGKSSIVESIKSKEFCSIIEYDAWKNEGFPFKLGFLKYLIKFAKSIGVNEADLNNIKNELSILQKVKEDRNEINYSIINLPNALIAIAILFYPLAFKMIEVQSFNPLFSFNQIKNLHINIIIFLIILVFGIFFQLMNYFITADFKNGVWNTICSINGKEVIYNLICLIITAFIPSCFLNQISANFILFAPLIIWLIFNLKTLVRKIFGKVEKFYILTGAKPHTESIITINKTPEPDYSDFKDLYSKILAKIKNKCGKKQKIIIVIDNIDRIETEEAKNIWACIKGMVLKDKTVNILIPIDETQVMEIYENNNENSNDNRTSSFIQKTFDITFRVSPFIMLDSKTFWYEKLDEAFDKSLLTEEQKDEIISIFDTRNDKVNDCISSNYSGMLTPRKIIKLINEVVSLQKTKIFENINIVIKFAYVLHYANINRQIQENKLSHLFPSTNNILIQIERYNKAEVAALYYTVSPKIALSYVKEESLCKLIAEENYQIEDDDAKQDWVWDILFNGLVKKSNEPYSILINILSNLVKLNEINPRKNDYLFSKIIEKITNLSTIDKLRKNDGVILSHNLLNIYSDNIKKIIQLIINNNIVEDVKSDMWYSTLITLIKKYKISKDELYNLIENHTDTKIYKEIIPIIKEEDYKLIDSYIFKPKELSEALFDIQVENLYKHLKFIIECPPGDEYITLWNQKMENVILPKIQNNINITGMFSLLAKALIKIKPSSTIDFIHNSSAYLSQIQNTQSMEDAGIAIAIYLTYPLNSNIANAINKLTSYPNALNKLHSSNEDYIANFVKTYISLNGKNITNILKLPETLKNKLQLVNYYIENIDDFEISSQELCSIYDQYIDSYDRLKELFDTVEKDEDFNQQLSQIEFSENNKQLLYLISNRYNKSLFKNNANKYFDTISKENWIHYLKTFDTNIKNAIIMEYEGHDFIECIKENLMEIFKSNQDTFIDNFKNEIQHLNTLDKSLKFINDFLEKELSLTNYDLLILNFDTSVTKWLEKTSHTHNEETIYTNFIRKTSNEDWLIKNKNIIKKYIITDEDKKSFKIQWQQNERVILEYQDILKMEEENEIYSSNNS